MGIQTADFAGAPAAPRLVAAARQSPQEEALERALRPKLLQEYIGQAKAREQLEIFIGAAKKRGHLIGSGIGGDVEILGLAAQQQVANAASGEERAMSGAAELLRYPMRFAARRFHGQYILIVE